MSYDDWNPDDLLNFDYGRPVPKEKPAGHIEQHKASPSKEAQLYAELRRQSRESENKARAAAKAQAEARAQAQARAQAEARQEALRQEAMRKEALRQEAMRKEALRQEAMRKEAARQAAIRKEAERQEAIRQEALRQEAARQAAIRKEAERQEAMRREAARQIAMRREAERQAALSQEPTQKEVMLREAAKMEAMRQQTSKEDVERRDAEKRRAQEEAYERYRNSTRNSEGKTSSTKANRKADKKADRKAAKAAARAGKAAKSSKFPKILAFIYLIALAAFVVVMTIMNVLPLPYLIAMYIILGFLSLILVVQLTKKRSVKRRTRTAASILAVLLIFVYGLGTAYSLGTLSFLSGTSVKNDRKVGRVSEEPFNVLITGMDVWGTIEEQGRSDVNMVVTVNPKTQTILMTSIPRDYEIRMEDFGFATDKLTHTGFYSTETTIKAIEDLLGININYYVKVNFDTIVRFIDAIGGLDFYNEEEFQSALSKKVYEKGNIHVQGRGALYYARERKAFLSGDNQRVKNQQVIFGALLEKATSSKTMIISYSSVLSSLKDYFEMSFSSSEIRSLVRLQIAKNPKWKIYKNTLYGQGATKPTYTGGSQPLYVTEQNSVSIAYSNGLINAVMEGKKLKKQDDDTILIVDDNQSEQTQ